MSLKFRGKPVVVEAMRTPTADEDKAVALMDAVYLWVESNTLGSFEPLAYIEGRWPWPFSGVSIDPRDGRMIIATPKGVHWVNPGDWVIRVGGGVFHTCRPDVFEDTYEPAGEASE